MLTPVNKKIFFSKNSSEKHPLDAWFLILIVFILPILLSTIGLGSIARLFFPIGSLSVGLFLYVRYPVLYVGFTWWIWMLAPFIARIADYRSGWDPQRIVMVAPYLVTLIPLLTLLKHLPTLLRQGGTPFVVCGYSLIYGTLLGLINNSAFSVLRNLLDWLTPITFGFYIFSKWRYYPQYRRNIQSVFTWGAGVTGGYGIYQYIVAPEWDRFWLIESGMFTSSGNPEPFGMRVWSTMHSPGPFACFITAALLILLTGRSPITMISNSVGYVAFLLTLVRTAWGSWLIGLFVLFISIKSKLQMKLLVSIGLILLCVFPLVVSSPFFDSISSRMQTLTNLSDDSSFSARQGIYDSGLNSALSSIVGHGFGGLWEVKNGQLKQIVVDSGILDMLATLGWIGTLPYLTGLFLALFQVFKSPCAKFDTFAATARAISLSYCFQMVMGTAVIGLPGLLIWAFLGIGLAADRYYEYENVSKESY
jgi:hypothetical protein